MLRVVLILWVLGAVACGGDGLSDDPVRERAVEAVTTPGDVAPEAAVEVVVEAVEASEPEAPQADDAGVGDADVLAAVATRGDDGRWSFEVTVSHPDTGWEDYANGWDVVLPDGTVVKRRQRDAFTRPLGHPHVDEQPFTRSQSRLVIPEGVQRVTVRAHELKHGFGGKSVEVDLPPAVR